MNCRKCGAKRITRRKAGVFSCNHCGVQPGPGRLDRGGLPYFKDETEPNAAHKDGAVPAGGRLNPPNTLPGELNEGTKA